MQIDGDLAVCAHQRQGVFAPPVAPLPVSLSRGHGSPGRGAAPSHPPRPARGPDIQVPELPQRQVPVDRRGHQGAFEGERLDALCRQERQDLRELGRQALVVEGIGVKGGP